MHFDHIHLLQFPSLLSQVPSLQVPLLLSCLFKMSLVSLIIWAWILLNGGGHLTSLYSRTRLLPVSQQPLTANNSFTRDGTSWTLPRSWWDIEGPSFVQVLCKNYSCCKCNSHACLEDHVPWHFSSSLWLLHYFMPCLPQCFLGLHSDMDVPYVAENPIFTYFWHFD